MHVSFVNQSLMHEYAINQQCLVVTLALLLLIHAKCSRNHGCGHEFFGSTGLFVPEVCRIIERPSFSQASACLPKPSIDRTAVTQST